MGGRQLDDGVDGLFFLISQRMESDGLFGVEPALRDRVLGVLLTVGCWVG
jgi:hypothetical protein